MGSWCSGLGKSQNSQYFGQSIRVAKFRVAKLFQNVIEAASRYIVDHSNSNKVKNKKIN